MKLNSELQRPATMKPEGLSWFYNMNRPVDTSPKKFRPKIEQEIIDLNLSPCRAATMIVILSR